MKIHVVEDDRVFNKLIEHSLSLNPDFEIDTFFDGDSFIKHLPGQPGCGNFRPGPSGLYGRRNS